MVFSELLPDVTNLTVDMRWVTLESSLPFRPCATRGLSNGMTGHQSCLANSASRKLSSFRGHQSMFTLLVRTLVRGLCPILTLLSSPFEQLIVETDCQLNVAGQASWSISHCQFILYWLIQPLQENAMVGVIIPPTVRRPGPNLH